MWMKVFHMSICPISAPQLTRVVSLPLFGLFERIREENFCLDSEYTKRAIALYHIVFIEGWTIFLFGAEITEDREATEEGERISTKEICFEGLEIM